MSTPLQPTIKNIINYSSLNKQLFKKKSLLRKWSIQRRELTGTLLGIYINSLKLSNDPIKYELLLSHFTDEETGMESLSNFSKGIQLLSRVAGIWTQENLGFQFIEMKIGFSNYIARSIGSQEISRMFLEQFQYANVWCMDAIYVRVTADTEKEETN